MNNPYAPEVKIAFTSKLAEEFYSHMFEEAADELYHTNTDSAEYELDAAIRHALYATPGAAAIDLYVLQDTNITSKHPTLTDTGLAFDIPPGVAALLIPRSSNGKYAYQVGLSNTVGLIDEDFKGSVFANFTTKHEDLILDEGSRFAQLLFIPVVKPNFSIVAWDDFKDSTVRGVGGNGSTGR